jgi:RNA polymerase sigma-70 factor (ECF subfamily)
VKEGAVPVEQAVTELDGGVAMATDEARVADWVSTYGTELMAHVTRMLRNPDDAEDVLQQVWMKAYRKPPEDGPTQNVRGWLYRVATNVTLDRLALERRRRDLLEHRGHLTGSPVDGRVDPDGMLGNWAQLSDVGRARVRKHLAGLPRKQREGVWFRWVEEADYATIADKLDCSIESARANVYHGLKRLRRELQDLWNEERGS